MAMVAVPTRAISDHRARLIVDTIVGPVTIEATSAGLCSLELPGPGELHLEELWADLDLPRRTPLPGDYVTDFGLSVPLVEIDPVQLGPAAGGDGGDGADAQLPRGLDPEVVVARCRDAVESFFACRLDRHGLSFHDLPVDTRGMSRFGVLVSQGMRAIPGGSVTSYSALARAAGNPRAPRGVGALVGANPVGLVVPCHRVVGITGKLTGYGGSLPLKVALLALEQRMASAVDA